MHKIDAPNATGTNEFTDGDAALGVLATVLWSKWLNTVQRELIALLVAAGIVPSDANDAQVLAAIQALIRAQKGTYVNAADGGPYASSIALSISSFVESTWRSVGPTGSGAQTIWTALDLVPAGANRIFVRLDGDFQSLNSPYTYDSAGIYARRHGSSISSLPENEVARFYAQNVDGDSHGGGNVYFYLPIDGARRFNVLWGSTFNLQNGIGLRLIGWDWNA